VFRGAEYHFGKKSSSLTVSHPIGFNLSNGSRASLPAHSGGLVASIITLPPVWRQNGPLGAFSC
jgi:hypothetical protein